MSEFVLRVGSHSAQGLRSNNEDRFLVDLAREQELFVVADGMGGQERGEVASGMAVDIIPRVVHERLAHQDSADKAMTLALDEANNAIIAAGKAQPEGRRMGTTAVCALHCKGQVYVVGLGDSRAYLVRGQHVEQLTVDHSVAQALMATGALTAEEAKFSPLQNVLYKFLGCANMHEGPVVKPFAPQAGDRLVLGSDGLTNHINDADLVDARYPDPQEWSERLVKLALERGSRDNVTCVVVLFQAN